MKIIGINTTDVGSTGTIATECLFYAKQKGNEVALATSFLHNSSCEFTKYQISPSSFYNKANGFICKLNGSDGFKNTGATKKLILWLSSQKPDIVHLHCLHGHYINVPLLVGYLASNKIPVVWTLHDCWPYTGKCSHYLVNSCYAWKNGCLPHCPFKEKYPRSFLPFNAQKALSEKLLLISSLPEIVLVSVSKWLDDQVSQSYFSSFKHQYIHNGIERLPNLHAENIKKDSSLIFSAANPWGKGKGLSFLESAAESFNGRFHFVVAGPVPENAKAGKNIKYLGRISKTYMSPSFRKSFVFFNPSQEETLGLVNIEAQSCGTPVILIHNSGGSEETIQEGISGYSIPYNDKNSLLETLIMCQSKFQMMKDDCIKNSAHFSLESMNEKYYQLYLELFARSDDSSSLK